MKCEIAKKALLNDAVKYYVNSKADTPPMYQFMSLYDDNEPYPLNEVMKLQKERIKELEKQAAEWETNESLQTSLFIARTQLKNLEKRYGK